jgi:LmbE family N-acetylglucosaminyl deacetylase
VVAPHPDDESLCCAGIIQRAVHAGARVAVVWVTSGDGFELDAVVVERTLRPKGAKLLQLAEARMREGECAAQSLGIPAERRYFLGYPDRGTQALLGDHFARPFRSPYTGAAVVPYSEALAPGSAYEGRRLEHDLAQVIDRTQPTMVLAPSTRDRHPDHAAVGEFVQRAMNRRGQGDRVFSWVVHAGGRWPAPRGDHPDLAMSPPYGLRALDWRRLPLDAEERAGKRLALGCHRSQMRVMRGVLLAFDRADEIFVAPAEPPATVAAATRRASAAPDAGLDQHGTDELVQTIRVGGN